MDNKIINNIGAFIFSIITIYLIHKCFNYNIFISLIVFIIGIAVTLNMRPYLRLLNSQFSSIDIVLTLLFAYLVAPCLNMSRESAMLLAIPVSIAFHKIFQVDTPLTKKIFVDKDLKYIIPNILFIGLGIYYK